MENFPDTSPFGRVFFLKNIPLLRVTVAERKQRQRGNRMKKDRKGKMGCTRKDVRVEESEQTDKAADCVSDKSLQVCHCGWSKVTTYQGLRTHQGKMGCTRKDVRVAESEQTDKAADCVSDKSLQVCHCGWSKVTTYQDLRTHQGKMGCTRKDVRVAESEQTDKAAYCFPGEHLRVCHCGWKKVTTYHGLRTHQGKMECTPKGIRIPESEQPYWANQWINVNQRKLQPAKKVITKKENVPVQSRINARAKSAAPTALINEEYEDYEIIVHLSLD
ncbi:uncharacterized protein [Thunnus thynnus]|uniref:uncharacterized protein n=1 Tax=Thunnus thynnus TaxID=8237 RepID=UPI003527F721